MLNFRGDYAMKSSKLIYFICLLSLIYLVSGLFSLKFDGFTKENTVRGIFFFITLLGSSMTIQSIKKIIINSSRDIIDLKLDIHLKFERNEDKIDNIRKKFMDIHNKKLTRILYYNLLKYRDQGKIPIRYDLFEKFLLDESFINTIESHKINKKEKNKILSLHSVYNDDLKFNNIFIDYKSGKFIIKVEDSISDIINKGILAFLGLFISVIGFIKLDINLLFKFIIIIILIGFELLEAYLNISETKRDINSFYEDINTVLNEYE